MPTFFGLIFLLISLASATPFDWQSHRGARGLYPENTINGMKMALKYPITTLEMDVVVSKDHQVVVSHEPWMNEDICLGARGKSVNLYQLNYTQIQKYDCGSKVHPRFPQQIKVVEHKPLLKDLLQQLEDVSKNFYSIEIKSTVEDEREGFQPIYKTMTDLVMKEILALVPTERFLIQSFDWRVLTYMHEKYPSIRLVALRETPYKAQDIIKELGFSPSVFSPDGEMLTSADVAYFHQHHIKVIPWTINTLEMMKRMIAMGVDGLITDYPNLISEIPRSSYEFKSACPDGYNRFEGACVYIPTHAEAWENNPGWICKNGYLQKREGCVKIDLPKHAIFSEDGKTWICKKGYERYRYRCQKIRKRF